MRSAALSLALLLPGSLGLLAGCAQDVVAGDLDASAPRDAATRDAATTTDAAAGDEDARSGDATAGDASTSDGGAADAAALDGGTGRDAAAPDASMGLACHVDRFSSCADADEAVRTNNDPGDSFHQNGFTVGCASDDDFVPGTLTLSSRVCHTEPADWFEVTYVPCDTLTMRARVTLTIDTPCDADAFELRVSNRPCDNSSADVRCTRNGLVQTIEYLLPPGNSVGSIDFGVVRISEDVAADYHLTYELYR